MAGRGLALGAAAVALYLATAAVTFGLGLLPVQPLFDALGPTLYRFVEPPVQLAEGNRVPASYEGRSVLDGPGGANSAITAGTPDRQAVFAVPEGLVPGRPGEEALRLRIVPLDPLTLGPPPAGTAYDGNAYEMSAGYEASGEAARPRRPCPDGARPEDPACISVLVQYAFGPVKLRGATDLYRRSGDTWELVAADDLRDNSRLYGAVDRLGTFVAAGPNRPGGPVAAPNRRGPIALGVAVVALVAGLAYLRLPRRSSRD